MFLRSLFSLFIVALSSCTFAEEFFHHQNIERYLDLYSNYSEAFGTTGSWKEGEIQVLLDEKEILKAQQSVFRKLIAKGFSIDEAKKHSSIGIIAEDTYWIWIRDAVIFPSGVYGTYNRIVWKNSINGPHGVAVLPVHKDKKMSLILNYRHSVRSWCLELPKGARDPDETPEMAAGRELLEETGYIASKLHLLGQMTPDTGTMATKTPVYIAMIENKTDPSFSSSEAISRNVTFTLQELKEYLSQGFVELNIEGKKQKVLFSDPFATYALYLAENANYIE